MTTSQTGDFSNFFVRMAAAAILDFENVDFLTVRRIIIIINIIIS